MPHEDTPPLRKPVTPSRRSLRASWLAVGTPTAGVREGAGRCRGLGETEESCQTNRPLPRGSRASLPPASASPHTVARAGRTRRSPPDAAMGCFFSKKCKWKSSEREERAPTSTTGETATATGNAGPLGNSSEEAPKQYSWDTREKVTSSSH